MWIPDALVRTDYTQRSTETWSGAALGPSRHIAPPRDDGRFSSRPVEVKHLQTVPPSQYRGHPRARASLRNWP
jgi:hypothetical protein